MVAATAKIHASDDMPIKERFRRLREQKGWTQQDLAVAAGLSVSMIAKLEAGGVDDPRVSTLRKIANALGIRLEDLAGEFGHGDKEEGEVKKPRKRK